MYVEYPIFLLSACYSRTKKKKKISLPYNIIIDHKKRRFSLTLKITNLIQLMVDIAENRLVIPINENILYIWEAVEESLIAKHDDRCDLELGYLQQ